MKIDITTPIDLNCLAYGISSLTTSEKLKFFMQIVNENGDIEFTTLLIKKLQKNLEQNQPS